MHFKALKKKKQVVGLKEVAMAPIQNQSGKSEGRARALEAAHQFGMKNYP